MNDSLQSLLPGIFQQIFNSAALPGGQNKMSPLSSLAKQNGLPGMLKLPPGMAIPNIGSYGDLAKLSAPKLNGMWNHNIPPAWNPQQMMALLQSFGLVPKE